jgi:hypothetical protein
MAEVLTSDDDPNLQTVFEEIMSMESVPSAAVQRYTTTGLAKRMGWEIIWERQRAEDRRERVNVSLPPKYDSKDFAKPHFWLLRGKLDVPKERFIAYPGAETEDDLSPVFARAGWDHLQQATALAALFQQRKTEQGWGAERLAPLLAGLLELVPWLKQWHNEPNDAYGGLRLGDYFADFVEDEARQVGLSVEDLRNWRPEKSRGRRTARTATAAHTAVPRASAVVDSEALVAAVQALDTESEGVARKAFAAHLDVTEKLVGTALEALVEVGRLAWRSRRPKRVGVSDSTPTLQRAGTEKNE